MTEALVFDGITARAMRPRNVTRPPLLLVHGMFGGAWQWERYQRFLGTRGWASYALNLRGHHDSRPVEDIGRVSVMDYVADARIVARALGRPIVLGHSMGGLIAQKLAEGGDVLAAVLIAAAPPRWIQPLSVGLLWRMLFHLDELFLSKPIVPSRADADALMFNRTPVADADEQYPLLTAESGRAGRELAFGTIAVDAGRVSVPIVSLGAAEDRFLVPRVARALAQKYRCELLMYPNHGHQLLTEPGWEMVVRAIADWMERHVIPGDTAA